MRTFTQQPTLLISSHDNPGFLEGIMDECRELGWRVINIRYAANYVEFQPMPVGAILSSMPDNAMSARLEARLRDRGIPIVYTSDGHAGRCEGDGCVLTDREDAGHLAADTFVGHGFADWGYVSFREVTPTDTLCNALRERAEEHGATFHLCQLATQRTQDRSRRYQEQLNAIAEWLGGLPTPLAVLAFNYTMGIRIIAASEMAGLPVPEQVAVACRGDNAALCRTAPVPLSAIDVNPSEHGRQAVRLVKRLFDGETPPRDPIRVPARGFIERRSTDILAVSDPRVAQAVRFIWDNLTHPLRVDDVAHAVKTSRNTLERAFQRTLNRGVYAELRRKRLAVCKELLRSTSMTLADISKSCGYGSSRHLHRSFKAAFGMTPGQYRLSRKMNQN